MSVCGSGLLVSEDGAFIAHARKLATQARDDAPHYQQLQLPPQQRLGRAQRAPGPRPIARAGGAGPGTASQLRLLSRNVRSHLYQRLGDCRLPSSHSHATLQRVDPDRGCAGNGLVRRRTRQRGEHPRVGPQLASGAALVCQQPGKSGPASEHPAWSPRLALVAAVAERRHAKRPNQRGMVGPFLYFCSC